jgi:hypothetical protein
MRNKQLGDTCGADKEFVTVFSHQKCSILKGIYTDAIRGIVLAPVYVE